MKAFMFILIFFLYVTCGLTGVTFILDLNGIVTPGWFGWIHFASIILIIISLIANVICAVLRSGKKALETYKRSMIYKLFLFPLYAFLIFLAIYFVKKDLSILAEIPVLQDLSYTVLITLFAIVCYFIIFVTGLYTILAVIKNIHKQNPLFTVFTIIFHLIPVIDILDSIYVYRSRYKKELNKAEKKKLEENKMAD